MRHPEEAPVAEAARGAAAAGADGGGGGVDAGGGGADDDVGADRFHPCTGNHCMAEEVSAPQTLRSPPLTSRGYR